MARSWHRLRRRSRTQGWLAAPPGGQSSLHLLVGQRKRGFEQAACMDYDARRSFPPRVADAEGSARSALESKHGPPRLSRGEPHCETGRRDDSRGLGGRKQEASKAVLVGTRDPGADSRVEAFGLLCRRNRDDQRALDGKALGVQHLDRHKMLSGSFDRFKGKRRHQWRQWNVKGSDDGRGVIRGASRQNLQPPGATGRGGQRERPTRSGRRRRRRRVLRTRLAVRFRAPSCSDKAAT